MVAALPQQGKFVPGISKGEESQDLSMDDELTLAAEVFQVAGILRQGEDGTGGQYSIPLEDADGREGTGGTFELARDDMHHLIGLLNSQEVGKSQEQFESLLRQLPLSAVEGVTRRLFGVLKGRQADQSRLQREMGNSVGSTEGRGRVMRLPSYPGSRRASSRTKSGTPRGSTSPRRGSYFGLYASESAVERAQDSQQRGTDCDTNVCTEASATQSPPLPPRLPVQHPVRRVSQERGRSRSSDRGPMPEVFQRLSADSCSPRGDRIINDVQVKATRDSHSYDQLHRARLIAEASRGGGPGISYGPPVVSEYVSRLLQRNENDTGSPRTVSRNASWTDVDQQHSPRCTPRGSEEKAKAIFDRLYKTGQELRCRRCVYSRIGELVQEATTAATCTPGPKVPLAQSKGATPLQGNVFDRLHRDMYERTKRREDLLKHYPRPSFTPHTEESSSSLLELQRIHAIPKWHQGKELKMPRTKFIEQEPDIKEDRRQLLVEVPKIKYVEKVVYREKQVDVPTVEYRDVVKHVPQIEYVDRVVYREKQVDSPKLDHQEELKPQIEYVERLVEVPRVEYVERIVETPKIEYVERLVSAQVEYIERRVEVPKIEYTERIVERIVPQIEYVERLVEVPKVEHTERIVERIVPQIQYVERIVEVPKIVQVPQIEYIERLVEAPHAPGAPTHINVAPAEQERQALGPDPDPAPVPVPTPAPIPALAEGAAVAPASLPDFTRATITVRSLRATAGDKKMDPFVELRYGRSGARTQVKKNGGRGVSWEEAIGPLPLATGQKLQCSVKDFDRHNRHEIVGDVQPLVLDAMPRDAKGVWEGLLDLSHKGQPRGTLLVKIQFLP